MKLTNLRERGKYYSSPEMEITTFCKDVIVMSGETSNPVDVDVSWNPEWNL